TQKLADELVRQGFRVSADTVARLIEPSLARDITLAWRSGRRLPPAVSEFLNLAREAFPPEGLASWQLPGSAQGERRT
ncbi:MAG: hypothetical protein KGL16_04765, partial [Acidobacteriota bacterium]|nr:hypothetical protein [Acidobacteriota bacterium]